MFLKKNPFYLFLANLVVAFVLMGCGTVQNIPLASGGKPPTDKALIIVERESNFAGGGRRIDVYDNGTLVGKVSSGGKLSWLRDPGAMALQFDSSQDRFGRYTTTLAGDEYKYNIGIKMSGFTQFAFTIDGRGVPISEDTKPHSQNYSLVYCRIIPTKEMITKGVSGGISGNLIITNIETGKTITHTKNFASDPSPWVTFFAPAGKYYISDYMVDAVNLMANIDTITIQINGEFAVKSDRSSVYIGDIMFSDKEITIKNDQDSATNYLLEKEISTPFTESIISLVTK